MKSKTIERVRGPSSFLQSHLTPRDSGSNNETDADIAKTPNHNMSVVPDKRLRVISRSSMFAPRPAAVNNCWIRRLLLANMSACIINSNAKRLYCLSSIRRQRKHSAAQARPRPAAAAAAATRGATGPGPGAQPRTHLDLLSALCTVSGFTVRS